MKLLRNLWTLCGDCYTGEMIGAGEWQFFRLRPALAQFQHQGFARDFGSRQQDALAFATLNFVTSVVMFNTLGVLVASLGHMDLKTAAMGIFRVPAVYAVLLAGVLNHFQVTLPTPLDRTVALAANGSIPVMIILLGLELSRVRWSHSLPAISLSAGLRLLGGPAVGLLLAALLGFRGAAWQGNVIESGMPAAVTTTVLATEYGLDTSLVTAMVFLGTILSPLTLTPLLVFLGK